jgi:hypothetical protein
VKVDRSIAEGPGTALSQTQPASRATVTVVGLLLALAALALYAVSNPVHDNLYTHFVWQADAFLHGRVSFPYPVDAGPGHPANWYFQDVYPLVDPAGFLTGQVLIPFPPLPAIVLIPFVAVFGLFTDQDAVAIGLGALGVAATWWMLGGLRISLTTRILITILFATGTVWWWAAAVGSTWYLAHLVAVVPAMLAVGVALRHDRDADRDAGAPNGGLPDDPRTAAIEAAEAADAEPEDRRGAGTEVADPGPGRGWAILPLDRSQVLAGLLLGVAATARLPIVFAAPFLMFVGGGGSIPRRTVSAGVGGFVPVALLVAYTFLTTGSLIHPGYEYQYRLEAEGYPSLGYHTDWSVEDVRYIPQNLAIMLGALPSILPSIKPDTLGLEPPQPLCTAPGAIRGPFDPDCPIAMPIDIGTSILLSAPGLLLALLAVARRPLARLTIGAVLATLAIMLFNLAHFSQGWVQWGYRFSLDFVPFLLPLVAVGAARLDGRPRPIAVVLVVAGAAINLWGVAWGQLLGW